MRGIKTGGLVLAAVLGVMAAANASAAIIITEVDPTGSSVGTGGNDWFELTNTGTSAVSISGWAMDDNSASFSKAQALTGVSSIAAGESVVFLIGNNGTPSSTDVSNFKLNWNSAAG